MKNLTCSLALPLLATSCLLLAVPAHAKKIEYVDMAVRSPLPELTVTGQNGSYDQVSGNGSLTFNAEAKGRCTWANAYKIITYRLTDSPAQFQYVSDGLTWKYVSDDDANRDRTWSSSMKPIAINWSPNQNVRNAAVQACNAQQQGKGGQAFSLTLNDQVWSQFSFQCSDLAGKYGVLVDSRTIIKPHPIKVNCAALAAPVPKPALPSAATLQAQPMTIGNVLVSAEPKNYQGVCPANVTFKGSIHTSGNGGTLSYRFVNNDQPLSPWQQLVVPAGKQVSQVSAQHQMDGPSGQGQSPQAPKGFQGMGKQGNGMQPKPQLGLAPTETIKLEVQYQQQNRAATDSYVINCQTPKLVVAKPALPPAESLLPDLTSRQGITIGQQSSPWGGVITLTEADISANTPRGCQFRMKYDVVNIGKADVLAASSRLSATGQLHLAKGLDIGQGQSRNASGNIFLKSGNYLLRADIDHSKQIAESNEGNNTFRITVNVPETCGVENASGRSTDRPSRPGRPQ